VAFRRTDGFFSYIDKSVRYFVGVQGYVCI
jgi:hypothetical protein